MYIQYTYVYIYTYVPIHRRIIQYNIVTSVRLSIKKKKNLKKKSPTLTRERGRGRSYNMFTIMTNKNEREKGVHIK